ncbi:unnamed protein product, partial [Coregonus sp. 'balchen']
MNTEEKQELKSSQDETMDISSAVTDERPQAEEEEGGEEAGQTQGEEEEAPEKNSESGMECSEPTGNEGMTGTGVAGQSPGLEYYHLNPSDASSLSRQLNCDVCGLSCVSINVLLVHKRSHTGERPFHCNQCGASFTQKGNLLRHIKLHSGEKPFKCPMCSYACRRRDALSGHLRTHSTGEDTHVSRTTHMGAERALLLDRLASNVAKRKSSMPQKFTGDNGVCLDLSFNRELIHRSDVMDPPLTSPGPENHHSHQPLYTGRDPDSASPHRASYPIPLSRADMSPLALTNGHKLEQQQSTGLAYLPRPSQGHSSLDSLHTDRAQLSQPLIYSLGHLLGPSPHNSLPHPHAHAHALNMPPLEALRVVRGEGEVGVGVGTGAGAVYPCVHCRVWFLDYVMFTIHMGCHGFRDPLECN